jgi:branched-chain amino acid transport system ATP-binding protein
MVFWNRIDGLDTINIKMGIAHIPEGRQLFPYLSVVSNLKLGASLRKDKTGIKKSLDNVFTLFPRLLERKNQKAGTLSGGEQQMLAIGRGLMASPRLLMMDEPSIAWPRIGRTGSKIIKNINQSGVTILLVEQNVHLA